MENKKEIKTEKEVLVENYLRRFYRKPAPCLKSAIIAVLEDDTILKNFRERLYPKLTKEYERSTIELEGYFRCKMQSWQVALEMSKILGYTLDTVRAKLFIAIGAEEVRMQELSKLDDLDSKREIEVITHLRRLGISADHMGYQYLKMAILAVLKDPKLLSDRKKLLNTSVRQKYDISYNNIHTVISDAIRLAYTVCRPQHRKIAKAYSDMLFTDENIPTVNELILTVAEEIRLKELSTKEDLAAQKEVKVARYLMQLGIPTYLSGYKYLKDAILATLEEPRILNNLVDKVYLRIAKKYNTGVSVVGNAITNAIEIFYAEADPTTINQIFDDTEKFRNTIPSNKDCIRCFAKKISN